MCVCVCVCVCVCSDHAVSAKTFEYNKLFPSAVSTFPFLSSLQSFPLFSLSLSPSCRMVCLQSFPLFYLSLSHLVITHSLINAVSHKLTLLPYTLSLSLSLSLSSLHSLPLSHFLTLSPSLSFSI